MNTKHNYCPPLLQTIEVELEKGFAQSDPFVAGAYETEIWGDGLEY